VFSVRYGQTCRSYITVSPFHLSAHMAVRSVTNFICDNAEERVDRPLTLRLHAHSHYSSTRYNTASTISIVYPLCALI
jgi:hypothetical protein